MKINANLNHTTAHLLAAATLKLFPDTKIGFGPAIDEGFYYDFKFSQPFTEEMLTKIEKQMFKLTKGGYKMEEAYEIDIRNQKYKQELVDDLKKNKRKITYWAMINPANKTSIFTDVCRGDHLSSVSKINFFKLLSFSGAYWKGDSNNDQLTRIYGTAWETKEELTNYLKILDERKERDHRKIGREMNIFMFDHLAGQGFPIWLEDGMIIKNSIQRYIRRVEAKYGFNEVSTPSFGEKKLYEISGHWAHYQEDMFPIIHLENEELIMRPMTCPHHILIYKAKRKSYKELPIRMSEQARLYRYEKSGALTGLERVRSMELTEGHVFARPDQLFEEFKNSYILIQEVLKKFNIEIYYVSLSLRDIKNKAKYFDDDVMWNIAENDLRNVLNKLDIKYEEKIGEAAFYGPKVDIQVKTALGHEITLSTIQLDFLLPKKFKITYLDKAEKKVTPILIHRGLIGTYERFIAILLEQTKGALPFWIAPKQVEIIPISIQHHEIYATKIYQKIKDTNIRVFLNKSDERLAKKIRDAQSSKVKFQIVIGDKEIESQTINVRAYGSKKQESMKIEDFLLSLKN